MIFVYIIAGLVALIILFFIALAVIGKRMPEGHRMSVALRLDKPPQQVWELIADVGNHARFDPGITKSERLPDRDGREAWLVTMGRNKMVLETSRLEPPRILERTIADHAKIFSGRWLYELAAEGQGSRLTLTEHGRVHIAIPRAMMHLRIVDATVYVKNHLKRLAIHLGEKPRLEVLSVEFDK